MKQRNIREFESSAPRLMPTVRPPSMLPGAGPERSSAWAMSKLRQRGMPLAPQRAWALALYGAKQIGVDLETPGDDTACRYHPVAILTSQVQA